MTNREYVNTLNNEELAKAIGYLPKICDEMGQCDPGTNCVQCCYKWLEKERVQTEIHKGEIRANISHGYYMVVEAHERNYRVMYLDGSFEWLTNSDIMTDEPTDMTMKKFLEIVMKKR